MRIASIDIGTNAVLLLIADVDDQGNIHPIEHKQKYPRLGNKVDEKYTISNSSFKSVADVLDEYKALSEKFKVDKITTCATSAVRDASNKYEFLTYLKKHTDIDIEVISGEDEALLTYNGAVSGLHKLSYQPIVLDIGGGSTELSFYENNVFTCYSLRIGAVRITERYFEHNPPTNEEIENAIAAISKEFEKINQTNLTSYSLVGVAGTITTLACLDQHLLEFDIQKVSGYRLSTASVQAWLNKLLKMTSKEIKALSNTTEGREDILPAGVLILNEFLKRFHFKEVIVSERGLRYGLALREWEQWRAKSVEH